MKCLILALLIALISSPTQTLPTHKGLKSQITGKFYSSLNCSLCGYGVDLVKELSKLHLSESTIGSAVIRVCEFFKVEDTKVCVGAVREFQHEVVTVIESVSLPSSDICALIFGDICSSSAYDHEWNVTLPDAPRPPDAKPKPPPPGSPTINILQISDIHIDLQYWSGSESNCNEPVCCHHDSTPASGVASHPAGYWGTVGECDLPERTLDGILEHISQNEQIDLIYWTGDLPPHNVWNQTKQGQTEVLQYLSKKLLKYFGKIPVLSAVGNHESAPVNSFPPPDNPANESEDWLYTALFKSWSPWLPNNTKTTILYGAYYWTYVKPTLRVISLNTNYCNRENWWLLLGLSDPAHELLWLANLLQDSEDKHEKVHILGHIPPGNSDCYKIWSSNYRRIVIRYSNTITGQFYGHTHNDHFQISYHPQTKTPLQMAYISPSITTYSHLNPGYRIYTVDSQKYNSTWAVLDHRTVIMDIEESNAKNKTIFKTEYTAKNLYKLPDMQADSWHQLTNQLYSNKTTFTQFYSNYYKSAPQPACNDVCKNSLICDLRTSVDDDRSFCKNMSSKSKYYRPRKLC